MHSDANGSQSPYLAMLCRALLPPSATNGYSEQSINDATTVRLREGTVGYEFPRAVLGKKPFDVVTISLLARSLYWYSQPA